MNRYQQFSHRQSLNGDTLSGLPFIELLYAGTDFGYEVLFEEAGRLDIIAYKWFKDASMWPYIALYNNIIDPIADVTPGRVIMIPTQISDRNVEAFTYKEV